MGNIDQLATLNLGVAFFDPAVEAWLVKGRMIVQGALHSLDDKVEKIRFICGIAHAAGKDHPIRTTGVNDLDAGRA